MTLRAHLFLLVLTVTIAGAALIFANEQWHSSLEQRQLELGDESVVHEQVRNISFSLQRFLVTYDLVVFSGITYLGDDALVQLENLEDALGRMVLPDSVMSSRNAIRARLQATREILENVTVGAIAENDASRRQAVEDELTWIVEEVDDLEGRITDQFESSREALGQQKQIQVVARQTALFSYGILICVLTVWASRRIAKPVDSLAKLAKHSIGTPIAAQESGAGPKEFRDIATSIFRLTTSLESVVYERTEALEGQVREHLMTQESLTRSHAELEKSISELETAQIALVTKERLSALGAMVGGISHDFNNVLVPIISYSSILLEEPDLDAAERADLLKIVMTSAEDAARIVERLQAFNRSTNSFDRTQELDIDELIEDAVAMSEPRWRVQEDLKNGPISVTADLGGVGTIVGDAPEIRQSLINLIFNAVDALPDGGEVRISTHKEGEDFVVLTVSDNGMGMSEETVASCQKPFFSTKNERGTGLGLAMVKNTAEAHNGRLEIDSTLGEGTSIQVWLKIAKLAISVPPEADPMPTPVLELRILLVDDELPVLMAHAAILRHLGYNPKTSYHPLDALDRLKVESFDLIITDLRMPEMSGIEFARRAKQINSNSGIFLLTAYEGSIVDEPRPPFIDVILRKPLRAGTLNAAIAEFAREGHEVHPPSPA
ncbi:MAG: response regulator [Proteobacteria bacterium]|nr:response regulator [Pseudomonadota bacterium]